MNIGYSFWGHLADYRVKDGQLISTPDGNASYSWSIVNELTKRGHTVYRMMPDRDYELVTQMGIQAFKSFAMYKRMQAYRDLIPVRPGQVLPHLDVLLHEWRMPIRGRNTAEMIGQEGYQPDFHIQEELLNFYADETNIVAMDLDYAMRPSDDRWATKVVELGWKRDYDSHVEIPFDFSCIDEFKCRPAELKICYIGNRYGRDAEFDKYLGQLALHTNIAVDCWGNWLQKPDSVTRFPRVRFHDRAHPSKFREIYGSSAVTPLILRPDYNEYGFMTARIWECALFGSIPVLPREFRSPVHYLPDELIVDSWEDVARLARKAYDNPIWRQQTLHQVRDQLSFMDVSNFVDRILECR